MSERAPYSRVYWSIIDDPKFVLIYDDDHNLASWLRLLLIADQAHPASAHLPANVRRQSIRALADAGLIDVSGQRYRVHGLDAERSRRRDAATNRRVPRPDPSGTRPVPEREAPGQQDEPSRAEDETSQAEPTALAPVWDDDDPLAVYWNVSGTFPSGAGKTWIIEMANEFGDRVTGNAIAREWTTGDRKTVLKRVQNRLRADVEQASKARSVKAEERETTRRAAMDITQEEADRRAAEGRRLMSEWTAAMPPVSGPFQPIGSKS